jgi:Zn-dependent protease
MSRIFLLLVAALKFGKLVPTVLSMVIAIGAYALVYGWRYAVGFVAMMLIHEMGHYVAARQRGLHVGLPTFIPFVGAWVELKSMPHDAETEAYVGLAGPMLGTVGAIAAWWLARDSGPNWLLAVAYAGFMINLFNLIPLPPMDGGRVTAVLSPRIWLLGVPILGWMLLTHFSPILLIVAILAVPHVFAALRFDRESAQAQGYYAVPARTRWEYGLIYVGLIAFLAYMTNEVDHQLRGIGRADSSQSQSGDV